MKRLFGILFLSLVFISLQAQDSTGTYKKKVLESTEVDMLMSYYEQDGDHAAVTGGIGNEKLQNITPTIVVSIPLSADEVLTADGGLSDYTSASSSNVNPFDQTGASNVDNTSSPVRTPTGSPWVESTGASKIDILGTISLNYEHHSDDRNFIWSANASFAKEYDYMSFGFGGSLTRLFNERNTEIGLKANVYLDQWKVIYPTEIHEYKKYGDAFLQNGYFKGVDVRDQRGAISSGYDPVNFTPIDNNNRNSYSASFSFSQILSERMQIAVFGDIVHQRGLLSTPFQRVYFKDRDNYYIGKPYDIPVYESRENEEVFHLADDMERLPGSRWKFPVGARWNFYISEVFKLRSYYRFYSDNWGLNGHTAQLEAPISLGLKFTLTPIYRYYNQSGVKYFSGYEEHHSSSDYYTSDYDLSKFHSHQIGIGFRYKDILSGFNIWRFGLKDINLRYNYYHRSDGLKAHIISTGISFALAPPEKSK